MLLLLLLLLGQLKLQERLGDYQKRLDGLKKNIQSLLLTLKSLNEKSTCFNQLLAQLLPWLQDHQSIAARELQITDPSYQVLQNQLTKCQVRILVILNTCSNKARLVISYPLIHVVIKPGSLLVSH